LVIRVGKENSRRHWELIASEQAAQNGQYWEQYLARQEDRGRVFDRGKCVEQQVKQHGGEGGEQLQAEEAAGVSRADGRERDTKSPAAAQGHAQHEACNDDRELLVDVAINGLECQQKQHLQADQSKPHRGDAKTGAGSRTIFRCGQPA